MGDLKGDTRSVDYSSYIYMYIYIYIHMLKSPQVKGFGALRFRV